MNQFHTDKINIDYYLKNNTPSFYQFKASDHHFFDKSGRKYIIMVNDNQPFKNKKFQSSKTLAAAASSNIVKPKECVVNNYNEITLYVKLAGGSKWFANSEIGRDITLYERRGENEIRVKLKTTQKMNHKVKVGRITVQGLSVIYCNELLNQPTKKSKKNEEPKIFSFEGLL